MKSLDQELSQGSFLILPITIIIGLMIYNYKKVRISILSVSFFGIVSPANEVAGR